MPSQKLTPKNFLKSFEYAIIGIIYFFRNERNAKVHLIIAAGVIIASFLLQISYFEWLITLLALKGIFTQEISNSVREATLDIACPYISEKVRIAKNESAGGVLFEGVFLLAIEIIILGPKIVEKIFN